MDDLSTYNIIVSFLNNLNFVNYTLCLWGNTTTFGHLYGQNHNVWAPIFAWISFFYIYISDVHSKFKIIDNKFEWKFRFYSP